jgi:membrane-associated phospholipid phosphatase
MVKKVRERIRKFWAGVALLSVEMLVVLTVFIGSLIAFVLITRRIFVLRNENLDYKVFEALEPYVNATNNKIMLGITFLGRHEFLIPANLILIAYFLFVKKHKWYSIKVPAIALSSVALMFVLKHLFGRARPLIPLLEEARGLSFPSGHALMSVTFYGLMIYLIWHNVKNPLLKWTSIGSLSVLVLLIGFSRIYLRVHYPTDVMAGFAMGFLWLVISISLINRMEKYSKRNVEPALKEPPVPQPQS